MEKEDLIVNLLREVRLEQKVNTHDISEIKNDVRRNADDLKVHMRRTDLNEKLIATIEEKHDKRMDDLESEISTVGKKLTVGHLLKLVVVTFGGIGTVSGAIYGTIKIIEHLIK